MVQKVTEDGYTKFSKAKGSKMKEDDILAAFKLVDVDGSGEISKMVKDEKSVVPFIIPLTRS